MNTSTKNRIVKTVAIVFLTLCSLVVLYPIIYVVSIAFSPLKLYSGADVKPFADGFSLNQYNTLFSGDFFVWVQNTLIIAVCVMICTVICCTLAAYVFSRFKFPMKKGMMMAMLILQIFPSFVGMKAMYVITMRIGAYNELWGLVLVYTAGNIPYNTWLIKSYLDTIPKSLDEAARIDGADHLKIFFRVILPMAKPMVIFLAITSFNGPWMDYIFPKMILSDDKFTLAIGLMKYVSTGAGTADQFTTFAAGALLVSVPFVIMFIVSQKAMVTGMGAGAVKE